MHVKKFLMISVERTVWHKRKKIAEMREKLSENVKAATEVFQKAEEQVSAAEKVSSQMVFNPPTLKSAEMVEIAAKVDEEFGVARTRVEEARKAIQMVNDGIGSELEQEATVHTKSMNNKANYLHSKIERNLGIANRFREEAKRREMAEVRQLEKDVISLVRHHRAQKGLSLEDTLKVVDADSDGIVNLEDFNKFFETCERKLKEVAEPVDEAEKKESNEDEEKKDEDVKEDATEDVKEAEEKKEPEYEPVPTPDELARVHKSFTAADEGAAPDACGFTTEVLKRFLRVFMRVVKDTVCSDEIDIKSKTVRRFEMDEVVEVLEGPQADPVSKLLRVRARAVEDAAEGWVTVKGTQGTVYLEEGGSTFKILKETILTDSFDLDSEDSSKKVKDTTRKLKQGEIVEALEWAAKEEKSGLMRMLCRCQTDGAVGWVTTVGNQGAKFVETVA